METQLLIDGLKKAIKVKGLNYMDLAKELGISERSINRIFSEGTFTLDRFMKVCELIGISLSDLEKMIKLDIEHWDNQFNTEQEEFFVKNFDYLIFYSLLFEYESIKKLAKDYKIGDVTIGKLLAQLEKLGLIEWLPGNEAKVIHPRKHASPDGPLVYGHGKGIISEMVDISLNSEKDKDFLLFTILSKSSQKLMREKMEELYNEMRKNNEIEGRLKIPGETVGVYMGIRPMNHLYKKVHGLRL